MANLRQTILVRTDLGFSMGLMAAQVAHVSPRKPSTKTDSRIHSNRLVGDEDLYPTSPNEFDRGPDEVDEFEDDIGLSPMDFGDN